MKFFYIVCLFLGIFISSSSYADKWCSSGGNFNSQSHCISKGSSHVDGWGRIKHFKNTCNKTIKFYYCFTKGGDIINRKYLCSSSGGEPTQFVGIGPEIRNRCFGEVLGK